MCSIVSSFRVLAMVFAMSDWVSYIWVRVEFLMLAFSLRCLQIVWDNLVCDPLWNLRA